MKPVSHGSKSISTVLLPLAFAGLLFTPHSVPAQTQPCPETNGVKYVQWPNTNGLDVWNSSPIPRGVTDGPWWLADDFVCTNTGPITDIHLWGSWQNDQALPGAIVFQLYLFNDVATNATNPFSHPGTNVLWHQTFIPGTYAEQIWSFNASEYFLDPGPPQILGGDTVIWYYCFYPTNLVQTGSPSQHERYWLAAFAELPPSVTNVFGWKTTTNVQHDISVHAPWVGYGLPPPNNVWQPNYEFAGQQQPLDLAFKLTTPTNQCPPPVIQCSNQVLECGTAWTITPPSVVDQCCFPPNPVIPVGAPVTNSTACSQVITLAWQYTDCQGRTVNCTNTVTIMDTNPPVFSGCITSKTEQCGSSWGFDTPTASYACSGSNAVVGILSMTNYSLGTCTNVQAQTWAATNACSGAFSTCTEVVTIIDTNPPTITSCPGNQVIYTCGSNAVVTWSVTATDACSTVTITSIPPSPSTFPTNTVNPVVVTVTDACGNQAQCNFTVTVLPQAGCNPVPCAETNGVKYVQWPNLLGGLDVWDSSSRPTQVTDGPWWLADDFRCTNSGPITDIHLWGSWQNDQPLTNSIVFQLYVLDDVPTNAANPFSHPGTNVLWHQTFIPGTYSEQIWSPNASEYFLDPGIPQILGPDSVVWYYCFYPTGLLQNGSASHPTNYWLAAFAELPTGIPYVFGWKSTTNVQHDISVHTPWLGYGVPPPNNLWQPNYEFAGQQQPFDLAFKLTTPTNQCPLPVLQCSNQVIECGTTWAIAPPPVVDQCCFPPNPVIPLGAPVTNSTACSQVITLAWQYTDCQGRTVNCTETTTIMDTNPPVLLNCGSNMTVPCGSAWAFTAPTAQYLCSGSNAVVSIIANMTNTINACTNVYVRTWAATNQCSGAPAFCSQGIVVVVSPQSMVFSCSNIVVYTCGTNAVPVTWTNTVTDTCSSLTVTSAPPSGTLFSPNTTNMVVVTAHDTCGNTNSCSFLVEVRRPVLGPLTYSVTGTNLVLQWTEGILQQAPTVLGAWTDVVGAMPPSYSTPMTATERFFRLRCAAP